jgi:hypothetical protein
MINTPFFSSLAPFASPLLPLLLQLPQRRPPVVEPYQLVPSSWQLRSFADGSKVVLLLLRRLRVPFYRRRCFAQALSQPALLRRLRWSSLAAFSPYWTLF